MQLLRSETMNLWAILIIQYFVVNLLVCLFIDSWLDNYPCYVQFIGNWVSKHMQVISLQTLRYIALAAVAAYLLVSRYKTGESMF